MSFRAAALDQRTLLAVGIALAIAGCAKKPEEPAAPAPSTEAPAAAPAAASTALEGQVDIQTWRILLKR